MKIHQIFTSPFHAAGNSDERLHSTIDLKIGDLVLMQNMHRNTKFDPKYVGPYEVIELTGPNTVKLKIKIKSFVHIRIN